MRVGDWVAANLKNMSWDRFHAVVAFAKLSGVQHVVGPLVAFCSKRQVTISVGIDHRGTSQEALEALLHACPGQPLYVCHHRGAHTFHPKLYLFANGTVATAVIGSSNFTEGGLFTNYEASLAVDLDLAIGDDRQLYTDICAALASWTDPSSGIVERLDDKLLRRLVGGGLVTTEAQIATEQKQRAAAGKPAFSKLLLNALFGSPPVPAAPPAPSIAAAGPSSGPITIPPSASGPTTPAPSAGIAKPVPSASKGALRWRKSNLQKSDAGRPSLGSAVTANLRLSQAKFVGPSGLINWQRYFRHDVFGHLSWRRGRNNNEETTATFNITAGGSFLGSFRLGISHNPKREEGQSNVTTVLHWGQALPSIQAANIVNKT